jgi:hypothetical protein
MRPDFSFERMLKRLIFVLTILGAHYWKEAGRHHIGKQRRVGTIGHAQTIIETLLRQAVNARELLQSLMHLGIVFVVHDERMGRIGGTFDPSVRLIPAELPSYSFL